MYVSLNESRKLHSLLDFSGRFIYPNNSESTEYNRICSQQIDTTVRRFFTEIIMMILAFNVAMIGPTYAFYMYGTRTTLTNVRIPFSEEHSDIELIANLMLTGIIGFHGFIGYIALEIVMAIFSDAVTLAPQVVEIELNGLNEQLKEKSLTKAAFVRLFNNIVKQCVDADQYGLNSLSLNIKKKSKYFLPKLCLF